MDFTQTHSPSLLRTLLNKLIWFAGFIGILSFVVAGLVAMFASKWLVVDDVPIESDAIIVLAGSYSRPFYAADLYHQGHAKKIFVSRPVHPDISPILQSVDIQLPIHEEIYRQILLRKNVPAEDIILYGNNVLSTIEEAESLKKAFSEPPKRLLIVTSPTHTRRAKIIFSDILPHTKILMLATRYEKFPEKWWKDRTASIQIVLEFSKTVFYYLGGAFRTAN